MAKVTMNKFFPAEINLLPEEFKIEELKRAKFYKIQYVGIATIMLFTFLSTLTIALRILQSKEVSQIQNNLTLEEKRISDQKTTQASLLLLKNRLTAINQYLGQTSKQVQMYELIGGFIPPSMQVTSFSVDSDGQALILASTANKDALDDFINRTVVDQAGLAKIAGISLESLTRGKDGVYRLNIKIKPK